MSLRIQCFGALGARGRQNEDVVNKKLPSRSDSCQSARALLAARDEIRKLKTKVRRSVSERGARGKSAIGQSIEAREIQQKIARLEAKLSRVEMMEAGAKKSNRWRRLRHEFEAVRRAVDAK